MILYQNLVFSFLSSRPKVNSLCNEIPQFKHAPQACHIPHVNILIFYVLHPYITTNTKYEKQDFQEYRRYLRATPSNNQSKAQDGACLEPRQRAGEQQRRDAGTASPQHGQHYLPRSPSELTSCYGL